ncbi:MAG: hypothetical protein KDA85_15855 [Planctomycetaceae bacterium]|nr:hypothetical protein [Planctomycetaceae bacterium]
MSTAAMISNARISTATWTVFAVATSLHVMMGANSVPASMLSPAKSKIYDSSVEVSFSPIALPGGHQHTSNDAIILTAAWHSATPYPNLTVASSPQPPRYVTGRILERELSKQFSWNCTGVTLLSQVEALQERLKVCIVLDRRVDPNRLVTLETQLLPAREIVLQLISQFPDLDVCFTSELIYVGPTAAVRRLPILLEVAEKNVRDRKANFSAAVFRAVTSPRTTHWSEVTSVSEIVEDLTSAAGTQVTNSKSLPHDLWRSGTLPTMTYAAAMTVILNQFDTELVAGEATFTMAPIDLNTRITRRYSVPKEVREDVQNAWTELATSGNVQWTGNSAEVEGTLGEHAELEAALRRIQWRREALEFAPPGSLLTRRFEFQAAQASTLGTIIEYFRQNNIAVEVIDADHPDVAAALQTQLEVRIPNLPADEFFRRLFGPYFSSVTVQADKVILRLR